MSLLQGLLIKGAVDMSQEHPEEFRKRVIPAVLIPLLGLILALLGMLYSLTPSTLEGFLEGADSPRAVIAAYVKWYDLMGVICIAGMALMVVCAVAAVIIGRKSAVAVVCAVCLSAIGIPLCGLMYFSEEVPALRREALEDMAQIESGRMETAEVGFCKNEGWTGLPGPYTEGQPVMFEEYRGIGDTTGGWRSFYIWEDLDFDPDRDRMYNENQSVDWNDEHACLYEVTYTSNFHVVTDIEVLN